MSKHLFVWLGSKRSRKHNVDNTGKLLDLAAGRGLPVPNGAILLHECYQLLLQTDVIEIQEQRVFCPNPRWLHQVLYEDVRLPRLEKPVAVCAAFSMNGYKAGHAATTLNVDATDPQQLSDALCTVWTAVLRREDNLRHDVLILEMVAADVAGVACSERAYQDDLVNLTGETAETPLILPQLRAWEPVSDDLPPFARRLQKLLRGVRRTVGRKDWVVEWADDGEICWLLQVHPLTGSTRRNEVFIPAPFRNVLSGPPPPLVTSILVQVGEDSYNDYRSLDATLPENRALVAVRAGRPLLNLSLLTDTMRHWGLPTSFVTDMVGSNAPIAVGWRIGRLLRNPLVLLRLAWLQVTAVRQARQRLATLQRLPAQTGDSYRRAIRALSDLFTLYFRNLFARVLIHKERMPYTQEQWRDEFKRVYQAIGEQLLTLAAEAVTLGQLPARDDVWLLTADEAMALDDGAVYDADCINQSLRSLVLPAS